tara:strand:- start:647 stop:1345 length:699 start_codon:yes stop_codon:yes gene_type:complete
MSLKISSYRIALTFLSICFLNGCFKPPFNEFTPDKHALRVVGQGATVGATMGAVAGAVVSQAGIGAIVGGAAGSFLAYQKTLPPHIIHQLEKDNIQFVRYGDTNTLIVPTDKYFQFDSPRINDLAFNGLNNIVELLKFYPCTPIYVAGFTDNVDSRHYKNKLSQAQAEAMVTFLWAKGIKESRLHPEGYGAKFAIGNNETIRGSAFNRRLEIQWMTAPNQSKPKLALFRHTK